MSQSLQWIRSVVYTAQVYLAMIVFGLVFLPGALVSRRVARFACRSYARYAIWTLRWMVGVRTEIRGEVPTDEVMVAAKHQSFLDILMIFAVLPRAKFIMKRELLWTPAIGQYAWRIGCVPVDRGRRGQAIAKMLADVARGRAQPGQLVIYPQGTRVAPGVSIPYKVGTAALFRELGQDCVPVATNVGLFWPRSGILKRPGLGVVEFLPRLPADTPPETVLARLRTDIEAASDRLMAEAGPRTP
ncbi:1-acyl-sn-glycerol-3-phosphate acyltransferase [Roseivivax jejudonensis]|uniref:1-acyl-sn-glycerol-3-phosphate acyltransferase n=1 Tax=Roseivivax jejudonensis TaxID=1529041 RepID=A0A1X6ZRC3_9RHOB|nr:1-acyl-sn-glycerol-3-phosphate acyltransferase [Roseivivax jejudonensis]SLN59236.1 1-acyl-sn-glycerol-3-phosphate acyltransferase [Roseivivax jejudonensis]